MQGDNFTAPHSEPAHRRGDGGRRQRYGRRRGGLPVGEAFVSRLGPIGDERFVTIDDADWNAALPISPPPETPIDQLRFCSLDCETTGQSPHRLVELGALVFSLHDHTESLETLVHSNDRINRFAERIHRINADSLAGAPGIDRVLARFHRFAAGCVLVEHSADAFDTRLIARSLDENFEVINLDTSRLAGRLWDLKDTIGLERLCRDLEVTHRRPHHALADAEATAWCFLKLVALGRERCGWATLGDLLEVGQPPPPRFLTDPSRRREPASTSVAAGAEAGVNGASAGGARRRRRGGRRRRSGGGMAGVVAVEGTTVPDGPPADERPPPD